MTILFKCEDSFLVCSNFLVTQKLAVQNKIFYIFHCFVFIKVHWEYAERRLHIPKIYQSYSLSCQIFQSIFLLRILWLPKDILEPLGQRRDTMTKNVMKRMQESYTTFITYFNILLNLWNKNHNQIPLFRYDKETSTIIYP